MSWKDFKCVLGDEGLAGEGMGGDEKKLRWSDKVRVDEQEKRVPNLDQRTRDVRTSRMRGGYYNF